MQIEKNYDEMFMQYTLSLAKKGWGKTGINPLVGAIVVKNFQIIGQGFHRKIGEAHAEVNALIDAGYCAKDATLYVNLEPCCCTGRTPPCVKAICDAQIKKVVIGMIDPNPVVNGKGIEYLKKNKIEISLNILEREARLINLWYEKYITKKIPYIMLKIAVSEDMKISGFKEKYITSEPSRRFVHSLRSQVSAILVGINTVLTDNPYLTDRLVNRNNPARVVIDPHLKMPLTANFLIPDSRRIIITNQASDPEKIKTLTESGVEFIFLEGYHYPLSTVLENLGATNIGSILVEGGGQIFTQFLEKQLYDELYCFMAPKKIAKGQKINFDENLLKDLKPLKSGKDLLYHVYRHN